MISATYLNNPRIHLTIVYAKCTEEQRRTLWQDLINMASNIQGAWSAIGDYNVITSGEEKRVGRSYRPEETLNFIEFLNECGLQDAGFAGSTYTWCDKEILPPQSGRDWVDLCTTMPGLTLFQTPQLLISPGHVQIMPARLLVKISNKTTSHIRYFKFFNFRTEYQDYLKTVQEAWEEEIYGNPLHPATPEDQEFL